MYNFLKTGFKKNKVETIFIAIGCIVGFSFALLLTFSGVRLLDIFFTSFTDGSFLNDPVIYLCAGIIALIFLLEPAGWLFRKFDKK